MKDTTFKESSMNNSKGVRLQRKIPNIMKTWELRAKNEILACEQGVFIIIVDSISLGALSDKNLHSLNIKKFRRD